MSSNILLIPHIKILNANALSSPYTIGFPAMTAWLGAVHAYQRELNQMGYDDLKFTGTAIACHNFNLQVYRGHNDFVNSIIGTSNPIIPNRQVKIKDRWASPFTRPAFVEKPRCHLETSLVIRFEGETDDQFSKNVKQTLHTRKLAGGDVLDFLDPIVLDEGGDDEKLKFLIRGLMPSYVLIERIDLMKNAMGKEDAITAMLEHLQVNHTSEEIKEGEGVWKSGRKQAGWIVPIAIGFQGITPLGKAKNQRSPDRLHRFAESLVTLGEFIMPYRIDKLDKMLWHYRVEDNLYMCRQVSNGEES